MVSTLTTNFTKIYFLVSLLLSIKFNIFYANIVKRVFHCFTFHEEHHNIEYKMQSLEVISIKQNN